MSPAVLPGSVDPSAASIVRGHVGAICTASLAHWSGRFLPSTADLARLSELADRLGRPASGGRIVHTSADAELLRRTARRLSAGRGDGPEGAIPPSLRDDVRRALAIAADFEALADRLAADPGPEPPRPAA